MSYPQVVNQFDKAKREKVMGSKNSFRRGKMGKAPKSPSSAMSQLDALKRKAGAM
jgi:hypothetical protein